jgi:hypothetical protein
MSYGVEIRNNSDNLIIGLNSDVTSLIAYDDGLTIAQGASLTVNISDVRNTDQFVVYTTQLLMQEAPSVSKGNGTVTFTNNSSYFSTSEFQYWVFRKG